jgi:hypothetical protein
MMVTQLSDITGQTEHTDSGAGSDVWAPTHIKVMHGHNSLDVTPEGRGVALAPLNPELGFEIKRS